MRHIHTIVRIPVEITLCIVAGVFVIGILTITWFAREK